MKRNKNPTCERCVYVCVCVSDGFDDQRLRINSLISNEFADCNFVLLANKILNIFIRNAKF